MIVTSCLNPTTRRAARQGNTVIVSKDGRFRKVKYYRSPTRDRFFFRSCSPDEAAEAKRLIALQQTVQMSLEFGEEAS
jgi:hypothetical protein